MEVGGVARNFSIEIGGVARDFSVEIDGFKSEKDAFRTILSSFFSKVGEAGRSMISSFVSKSGEPEEYGEERRSNITNITKNKINAADKPSFFWSNLNFI